MREMGYRHITKAPSKRVCLFLREKRAMTICELEKEEEQSHGLKGEFAAYHILFLLIKLQ